MARQHILELKIITMGDALSGKSSLLKFYLESLSGSRTDLDVPRTVGVDVVSCPGEVSGEEALVHFFDLAGGPEYAELRQEFYGWKHQRNDSPITDGALLVFDVSDRESLKRLEGWLAACTAARVGMAAALPMVLVGNKSDRGVAVTASEARAWAKRHGDMPYYEVSAVTGESVVDAFARVLEVAAASHIGLPPAPR